MRIEYLDYFYKVALAGSISKVANSSHISQSALSQQISKLEDVLGYKLLERSNRGVELTDKGMIVLKYTDNIIRTYETMIEQLEMDDGNSHHIKMEACWSIATYSLPCVIYKMRNKFSKYHYDLNANESDQIEEDVSNNICDLGVIYSKPKNKDLMYHKIGKDRLVLVSSMDFKIPDEILFKDLAQYPLILLNSDQHLMELLTKKMGENGQSMDNLEVLFNSDSVESVRSSVLNKFGIGFLPYVSIKKDLYNKELKLIDIQDFAIQYDMYLIYDKQTLEDKIMKEFIEYFKQIAHKSLC